MKSSEQVIRELQNLKKQFENKGLCKIPSKGDECTCPLCVIDDATALIEKSRSSYA